MTFSSRSFSGTRCVLTCAGLVCALYIAGAQAGTFDDLAQTLKQGLNDAAHKSFDSAIGNTTSTSASTATAASHVASQQSGSPGATPSPVAVTPLDPADPTCLVFRPWTDGETVIQNRACIHDPYFLVHSDKVAGCAWHAMKRSLVVHPHSMVAICDGRPDQSHSCECTGKTLWKGGG